MKTTRKNIYKIYNGNSYTPITDTSQISKLEFIDWSRAKMFLQVKLNDSIANPEWYYVVGIVYHLGDMYEITLADSNIFNEKAF